MKKILLLTVLLALWVHSNAQVLSPQSLGSFGRSNSGGNLLLEDQLGSLCSSTITTNTFMYTQGFLQPYAGTTNMPPPINDVVLSSGNGIDNAGTTFIRGGVLMLEFTTGEFVCITLNSVNNMLTQGILQPLDAKYWTGLVNSDWRNVNNWAPPSEPTPDDHAIIPALCPNYPVITIGVTANCKSLTAKPGSSVTVNTGGQLKIHN